MASKMFGTFTDTAAHGFPALTRLMAQLIAIKTNNVLTLIGKMTGAITSSTRVLLAIMRQTNKEFTSVDN